MLNVRSSDAVLDVVKRFHTRIGEKTSIVATKLDKPIYKPRGSTEASPSTEVASVVSLIVLSCDGKLKQNKGSIALLDGYEKYSELLTDLLAMRKDDIRGLCKNLKEYNRLLRIYYDWRNSGIGSGGVSGYIDWPEALPKDLEWCGYSSLPEEFVEMAWFVPQVSPGDVLSWKASTPYKAEKNNSSIPFSGFYLTTMVASNEWYASTSVKELKNGITTGMVGRNSLRGSEYNVDEYKLLTTNLSQAFSSPVIDMGPTERLLYSIDQYTQY
jgi:hypothetical protein